MADYETIIGGLIMLYLLVIDPCRLLYIMIVDTKKDGTCIDDDISAWGPWSYLYTSSLDTCSDPSSSKTADPDKCPEPLGKYSDYAKNDSTKTKECLCKSEIDDLVKNKVDDSVIAGYNATQLIAWRIVPFMTVIGIIYAFIFTRTSSAEWIFWIIIATVIFTGLTSIAYTTEIPVLPENTAPLSYITDKLNMGATDELKYSFIARKVDGSECFVEGTMLGGGSHPENQPPIYTGDCTSASLPMY